MLQAAALLSKGGLQRGSSVATPYLAASAFDLHRAAARCLADAANRSGSGGAGAAQAGSFSASANAQSAKTAKLFQKVLDGEFKPPEEAARPAAAATSGAAAPAAAPSVLQRVASIVGNTLFYGTLLGGAGFLASTYAYSDEAVRRMRDDAEKHEGDGPAAKAKAIVLDYFCEAREWYSEKVRGFTEPATDSLLPDMLPIQKHHRLRTLVLDLDGVLVQSVWQRKHGWKVVKRPGAEAFLETMAQYYELVVFTNRSHSYADPILNRIDPGLTTNQGPLLMYRLYKNSTQWRAASHSASCVQNNESIRDLTKLNRDLDRTIFVVSESKAKTVEPADNLLVLPDYSPVGSAGHDAAASTGAAADGGHQDTVLFDVLPLLELIWKQDVPDTRAVCRSYQGKHIVEEFRRRNSSRVEKPAPAAAGGGGKSRLARFGFG